MREYRLWIVTGLPGTGKSTLARRLARHHGIPLLAKDAIKEPLLDVLGADPAHRRKLSDAAFAVLFAMAEELLASGTDVIVEGNFRVGEHEAPLLALLPNQHDALLQVLCRTSEPERLARLTARANDAGRHPGHADAEPVPLAPECDAFLQLPGERLVFDTNLGTGTGASDHPLSALGLK